MYDIHDVFFNIMMGLIAISMLGVLAYHIVRAVLFYVGVL